MASTIQIKRGTGSAVPSGLSDGELAINLDSGKLYYGSGSNSVNSYTVTNITASGDISSSGTITANKIISTGTDIELTNVSSPQITIKDTTNNNTLVLEQDNTRSHIRFDDAASNDLHFDSNADNNHLVLDSGNGNSGFGTQVYDKTSKVTVTGDIFASGSGGHITASGNISASGTIIGKDLTLSGDLTVGDDATINGNLITFRPLDSSTAVLRLLDDTNDFFTDIKQGNSFHIDASHHSAMNVAISTNKFDNTAASVDTTATTANAHIFLDGGTGETVIKGTPIYFGNNTDASTAVFSSHITASGNISASLTTGEHIFGGNISIGGALKHIGDSDTKISFTAEDTFDITTGNAIQLRVTPAGANFNSGHITSSGNISASAGTILSVPRRHLDQTAQSTNGSDAQGDIYYAPGSGAGVSTTKGLVYGLATNGNLFAVDRDTESTCTGLVAVAIGDNSLNDGMLLRGMVKLSHDPFPGGDAAIGKAVYIGDNGQLTGSIDGFASDDFIRIVGYEMESGGVIYFNPDNTFIKKA